MRGGVLITGTPRMPVTTPPRLAGEISALRLRLFRHPGAPPPSKVRICPRGGISLTGIDPIWTKRYRGGNASHPQGSRSKGLYFLATGSPRGPAPPKGKSQIGRASCRERV